MYFGIDFSGGAPPWRARCSKPTDWIATIDDTVTHLLDLRPVQALPGDGEPFGRLLALLHAGDYIAAGIDAPFCIPAEFLPPGGHAELLDRIDRLLPGPARPFPLAAALIRLAEESAPLNEKKPYRSTERAWIKRGINTRSTLWNKPRGGAAFAAACLTLLARSRRPVWPWQSSPGMLVEAFPAAQLQTWGLPYSKYSKPEYQDARKHILAFLNERLEFSGPQQEVMLGSSDALDAVSQHSPRLLLHEMVNPSNTPLMD